MLGLQLGSQIIKEPLIDDQGGCVARTRGLESAWTAGRDSRSRCLLHVAVVLLELQP